MGKTLRRTVEKSLAALLFNAHTGGGTRIRATTDATMQLAIINCAPAVTMAIGGERERERGGGVAHYSATEKNPTNEARCPIAGFLSFGRVLRERKRILWNSFRWPRLIKVPLSSPTKGDLLPHFAFPEEIYILVNCVKLRESIFFFQFKAFKVFFKIVNSNAREKKERVKRNLRPKCKVSTISRRGESRNSSKKRHFVVKKKEFGLLAKFLDRRGTRSKRRRWSAHHLRPCYTGYVNYTCKYSEATEARKIERRDIEIRVGDPHTFASSFRRFYAIERSWLKVTGYLFTI